MPNASYFPTPGRITSSFGRYMDMTVSACGAVAPAGRSSPSDVALPYSTPSSQEPPRRMSSTIWGKAVVSGTQPGSCRSPQRPSPACYKRRGGMPSGSTISGTVHFLSQSQQLKEHPGSPVHHRSPAMAARLTDHIWTVREWLLYPVVGGQG